MNYLGIDYGTKKVGVAYSEGIMPRPLKTIGYKNLDSLVEQIQEISVQKNAPTLVVGYPEGANQVAVDGLIRRLRNKGLIVETVDETLTTWQVYQDATRANIKAEKVRQTVDQQAAANILQIYLDGKS